MNKPTDNYSKPSGNQLTTSAGNLDNYFAEIEQAAFAPSNIVPGIGFSPDKMLQARVFSYADAHRYRLGTHYEALPVNAPRCPATTDSKAPARPTSLKKHRPRPESHAKESTP